MFITNQSFEILMYSHSINQIKNPGQEGIHFIALSLIILIANQLQYK